MSILVHDRARRLYHHSLALRAELVEALNDLVTNYQLATSKNCHRYKITESTSVKNARMRLRCILTELQIYLEKRRLRW